MDENNPTPLAWRTTWETWLLYGVTAALAVYAFWGTMQDMAYVWNSQEEYGYGYFIPIISILLIWQRKNILAEIEYKPSIIGIILTVFGGLVYLVGILAASRTIPQYALILTLIGIAYASLGWAAFKIVLVPLSLLVFMVPLPLFIFQALSAELQLISSKIGVEVIRWFDISVYLEGNVIDLGSYKLQVVEACSGLRYLFPLVSLSFLAAYLYKAEFWKKAVIFISSIPITVLMNSFRIGVIGVLVEYWGIEQAEGFLHDFEGWIVFMACIAILVIEMAILARIGSKKKTLYQVFAIEIPEPISDDLSRNDRKLKPIVWILPIVVALVGVGSSYLQDRENIVPDRRIFAEFPLKIGSWKGATEQLEENILESLKTEDYIIADYLNDKNRMVNFYIAYYADQISGGAIHSPRGCIPGGGWIIEDLSIREIKDIDFNGSPLYINRVLIRKGDYSQVVYYWFQERGRNITSEWAAKWYLFWDSLTKKRTDGSLIRLTAFVTPGEDLVSADERLKDFLIKVYPHLEAYVPG